jgi:acetyl-CoA/propionyl-CoA carboxylase biotin carboxyl carrier protein
VGPGIRVDSGVCAGSEVGTHYDSLLAKVVAHAPSRDLALARLDAALARFAILGPPVNTAFLRGLLADRQVRLGELDTGLVERLAPALDAAADDLAGVEDAVAVAALARSAALRSVATDDPWESLVGWRADAPAPLRWRLQSGAQAIAGDGVEVLVTPDGVRVGDGAPRAASAELVAPDRLAVTLDGTRREWAYAQDGDVTRLGLDGRAWGFRDEAALLRERADDAAGSLSAPMPGSVLLVHAGVGDDVAAGDVLVVLESMKMELQLVAPASGSVARVAVAVGDRVASGQLLVELDPKLGTAP